MSMGPTDFDPMQHLDRPGVVRALERMKGKSHADLMIVDGNHMLHRILHLDNFKDLKTKAGVPTGGVYGALTALRTALNFVFGVKRVIVVWDGGRSMRRLELYPDYKQNRRVAESATAKDALESEEYFSLWQDQQRKLVHLLPVLGVKSVRLDVREADDVIALICGTTDPNTKVVVVSEDKDMYQLVRRNVSVLRPVQEKLINVENFKEMVGCPRALFLVMKSLLGDGGDNIRGISGVSDGTVGKIVAIVDKLWRWKEGPKSNKEWAEVLDLVVFACRELSEVDTRNAFRYAAVIENMETVRRNRQLVDMSLEVFTQQELDLVGLMSTNGHPFHEMTAMFECSKLEFISFVKSWSSWSAPFRGLQ